MDSSFREAIVNTIPNHASEESKQLGIVEDLVGLLSTERNLRVRARIVVALNKLTKKSFRPLEVDAVKRWWAQNKENPRYRSPYSEFLKVMLEKDAPVPRVIESLDATIKKNPDALFAACSKAWALVKIQKLDEAEALLKDVEKRQGDFRWLHFVRAMLFVKRGESDNAVKSLNAAMQRSPGLEMEAETHSELSELLKRPDAELPNAKVRP